MIVIKKVLRIIYKIYQKIFNKILQPYRKRRNILLYCIDTTFETHIIDFYNQIKNEKNLKFYLFYKNKNFTNEKIDERIKNITNGRKIIPIKNIFFVLIKHLDLVVCADVALPTLIEKDIIPTLYINHGLHIMSYDGGESFYTYAKENSRDSRGNYRFTIMFEPNKRIAKEIIAKEEGYKDIIKAVGYKFSDNILTEKKNYNYYREKLGINKKQTVVLIFGTWNKNSLFHLFGEDIISQAKKMNKEKYKFILSIHPKEYYKYNEEIEPLGEYIESQEKYGFIIRNPAQDFIPYLIASDIVISDHTSMYELALIADKKLILCDIPDDVVSKHSIFYQLKHILPIYKEKTNLEDLVQENMNSKEYDKILEKYRNEIVGNIGEYSEKVKNYTYKLLNFKGGDKN